MTEELTSTHPVLNKVPGITLLFWLTKLISTGLGESVSDFSSQIFGQQNGNLGELFTVAWSLGLFAIFLTLQFRSDRYRPVYYWASVALLAVFGTFSADTFKTITGLHYMETTLIFGVLMVISFAAWYLTTHDLSIHHITTAKKEGFYWLTVAFSFMLGTAAGDWFATARVGGYNVDPTGLGLGFLNTGLILGAVFVALIAYRVVMKPQQNSVAEITTFWLAYILTRPVGASFADYFGYNFHNGFLGNQGMSVIWIVLFAICLGVTIVRHSQTVKLSAHVN
ncbi:COG4705 family protein [Secundilactobacillus muriivasis]